MYYKIEIEDSFLINDEKIFYSDSISESVNYMRGKNSQFRFLCISSEYTTTEKNLILIGKAYQYTHENLISAAIKDALLKDEKNIYRRLYTGELDDCMIYSPMSSFKEESTGHARALSEDYWSTYIVFKDFVIANKGLYGDIGYDIIDYMKSRYDFKFSTKSYEEIINYAESGIIPIKKKWRFK